MTRFHLLSLVLLLLVCGCASTHNPGELRQDPRFLKLLREKGRRLPYRLCIGTVEPAFDPAVLNKDAREKHALVPDTVRLRDKLAGALEDCGLFETVDALPVESGTDHSKMLEIAWERDFDLLLEFRLKKCLVSFEGHTNWYVPNLVLWFCTLAPSWWVRDETYKLSMEVEARFFSVHTEKHVHSATFKLSVNRNLNDFQRGWQVLDVLAIPGAFKESNWRKIYEKLEPQATREAEITLAESVLAKLPEAALTKNFRSAVSKTVAVVVGLSRYKDPDAVKLQYSEEDALGFYKFLIDKSGGGLLEKHVLFLANEKATKQAVEEAVTGFLRKKARPWDRVIFYFAGYGAVVGESSGPTGFYLVTYDSELTDIPGSAVSIRHFSEMVNTLDVSQFALILDTAFNSKLSLRAATSDPKAAGDPFKEFNDRDNSVVLSAGKLGEGALEIQELRHGVFTFYLLEGLTGKADANKDGIITVREAFNYLSNKVIVQSAIETAPQHPLMTGKASEFPLKVPKSR